MTVCKDNIKELIALYATDDITINEKDIIDEHIEECQDCRYELEIYKSMVNELNICEINAPDSFHSDAMEHIGHHTKFAKYIRYQPYLSIAAAILFVVFLGVVGLMNPNLQDHSIEEFSMTNDEVMIVEDAATSEEANSSQMRTFEADSDQDQQESMLTKEQVQEDSQDEIQEEAAIAESAPKMPMEAKIQDTGEGQTPRLQNEVVIGVGILVIVSLFFIYRKVKKR